MADAVDEGTEAADPPGSPEERGKTVHGEAANAGHRVLAPDDAEVEAYLETALHAPAPDRTRARAVPAQKPARSSSSTSAARAADRARVRELDVYSELLPYDTPYAELEERGTRGIILSGGPNSVYDDGAPKPDAGVWSGRIPSSASATARSSWPMSSAATSCRPTAGSTARQTSGSRGTTGCSAASNATSPWMSHGDLITRLPEGFQATAQTDSTPFAGLADPGRGLYGIQFHPEVVHTPRGRDILRNFVVGIAGVPQTWTAASFIDTTVAGIRERVDRHAAETGSDGKVICALSGGVDSAVAAALVHRAVGDPVDVHLCRPRPDAQEGVGAAPGDLRAGSWDEPRDGRRATPVPRPAGRRRGPRAETQDHRRRVHPGVRGGGREPRPDRFPHPGHALSGCHRSATAETKAAQKIKTHHNVGGLPADLRFKLVEPLRYLFKDEVRRVGMQLGLPEAMVLRQPFPGPGLAIRIIGEVTAERLDVARSRLDRDRRDQGCRSLPLALAVVRDPHSGSQRGCDGRRPDLRERRRDPRGDVRGRHDRRLGEAPLRRPRRISSRIVNEVPGVNRVVYDISSKPPATIEWE